MYDTLTTSYTFNCPIHGETHVRLSRFRRLEQLAGAQHPALFRVEFECGCGEDHPGLVSHDDLDWAPLGLQDETTYVNLMTSRVESLAQELGDLAASRIKAGEWPWSFFCFPEERPRPVYPSAFKLLAPAASGDRVAVAVRCPVCVQAARAGCERRPRRRCRSLSRLRQAVREPRLTKSRRRAVRQRPRRR